MCTDLFSQSGVSFIITGSRVRDWNSLHFWEGKDLASLGLHFLYSSWYLAFLLIWVGVTALVPKQGGGKREHQNRMCIKHVFLLFESLLASEYVVPSPYSTTQALSLIHMNFWFSWSWSVFGNVDTTLWLIVSVAGYLFRYSGMIAKTVKQKVEVKPT